MFKTIKMLNTKEFCFLCLQTVEVKREAIHESHEGKRENEDTTTSPVSLRCLQRHFKINFHEELEASDEIEASLCKICKKLVTRYSALIQQLEKVQLEMDYYQEMIEQRISNPLKDPQIVQNYSKRMTSDVETLSQLAFIDKLRKEICVKASDRFADKPIVKLFRVKVSKPINLQQLHVQEIKNETAETSWLSDEEHFDLPTQSTPSSPPLLQSGSHRTEQDASCSTWPIYQIKGEKLLPEIEYTGSTRAGLFYSKDADTGLFHCQKCDKTYPYLFSILRHYDSVHLHKRYKCDLCKILIFTDQSALKYHKKTCLQNMEKNMAKERDSKFVCTCGKKFAARDSLNRHKKRTHQNVDRYPCDLCLKKFKQRSHLQRHKDSVHLRKKFFCPFCKKLFVCSRQRAHKKLCSEKRRINAESEVEQS